jgi:hypothetical protein
MPRTKKQRRERKRQARNRDRALRGVRSLTADLDSLEFSTVFRVENGRKLLGMVAVGYDSDGKRVEHGTIPNILSIGRDKASKLMEKAKDAQLVQARREALRVKRETRQTRNILESFDKGDLQWVRRDDDLGTATISLPSGEQFVTCQQLKSYLVGSSDLNEPPVNRGVNQVVCFRGDDMRFYVGEETYDENSDAKFAPLNEKGRPVTYPSRESAERSILLAIEHGEIERLENRIVGNIHARMDKKLRVWETDGADAMFEEYTPKVEISDQYQRVSPPVKYTSDRVTGKVAIAPRIRPQDGADIDFRVTARVGAKRTLRVDPAVQDRLSQNRADCE